MGNSTFAERLKYYMESHDLSFRDMEKITDIPAQTIHRYVHGQRTPKINVVPDLARKMNVSDRWLMGLDEEESPAISEDDKALLEEVSASPELMNLLRILKQIEPDRLAALAKLVEPML